MTPMEHTLLIKGIAIGISAILPFLIIALVKWHVWKADCKFWKTMHSDLNAQNERLFRAVKDAETKAKYAEAELKHVLNQYKPL